MRIRRIRVHNFKSLVGFELRLANFTCLIGLNGAGKSTVLQFVDFLAQQVRGDIQGWLDERNWQAKDIKSRLTSKQIIEFHVHLTSISGDHSGSWWAHFNPSQHRCTKEHIQVPGATLQVQEGTYKIARVHESGVTTEIGGGAIEFEYEGSLLSQLKESSLPTSLREFKRYFASVNSLDLLSPELLRQRSREAAGSLGVGGKKLSAYLHELGPKGKRDLTRRLRQVYKQLTGIETRSLRSGWKQLEIKEQFNGKRITTEASHVADGMLRLFAILAELKSDHRFLSFDEVENGINPELVEFVLEALTSTDKQVLVTTHSPMILNYLSDEVAKEGVIYLYKTPQGATRAIPFFSIPSLAEKLTVMGPGEAFVDTDLTALSEEIEAVTAGQ